MVARHYYRNDEGDMEAVDVVLRWGYTGGEQADEGQSPKWEAVVDDPDMTLNFVGHRRWIVYETESDDPNEILLDGITQGARIAHTGGDITQPIGRVWVIEINDLNALWTYRVMTGSDSQRPEETDVERMTAIATSEEMGYFDDLTLISTDDPVDMDAANVRGQTTGQVADQCAQESGKNYWISSTGNVADGADIFLWYGSDGLLDYTSPLSLSNHPLDLDMPAVDDGTAIVYPIGADTELRRDYARQYSGAYGAFQDGAKYIPDTENPYDPNITLSGRDIAYPAPEIKTKAQMKARLLRVLRDHATPDEVITTTITLPANKATQLRAGMLVAFRATHLPGYEEIRFLRVMSAAPSPVGNRYTVKVELQGPGHSEPIEGTEVSMVATNTVLEDANRNGYADTIATYNDLEPGQVWEYTVTNTQHATIAFTKHLTLSAGAVLVAGWGDQFGNTPPPVSQGAGAPFSVMAPYEGTFVYSGGPGEHFTFSAHADYAGGVPSTDEQWTIVLEQIG